MKNDSFITFPMGYMCFDYTKRESMQVFCMEGLSHVPYLSQIQQTVALRTACIIFRTAVLYYMYFSKIYWVMTATYAVGRGSCAADGLTERDCVTI